MDTKTMVQGSKAVGREVSVTKETETPATPGSYHEYMGSDSKASDNSYSGRMSALESALGNKDNVKG